MPVSVTDVKRMLTSGDNSLGPLITRAASGGIYVGSVGNGYNSAFKIHPMPDDAYSHDLHYGELIPGAKPKFNIWSMNGPGAIRRRLDTSGAIILEVNYFLRTNINGTVDPYANTYVYLLGSFKEYEPFTVQTTYQLRFASASDGGTYIYVDLKYGAYDWVSVVGGKKTDLGIRARVYDASNSSVELGIIEGKPTGITPLPGWDISAGVKISTPSSLLNIGVSVLIARWELKGSSPTEPINWILIAAASLTWILGDGFIDNRQHLDTYGVLTTNLTYIDSTLVVANKSLLDPNKMEVSLSYRYPMRRPDGLINNLVILDHHLRLTITNSYTDQLLLVQHFENKLGTLSDATRVFFVTVDYPYLAKDLKLRFEYVAGLVPPVQT